MPQWNALQPMDPATVAAAEKQARRAVKECKLAVLEQLLWDTDFRRDALKRANEEPAKRSACEYRTSSAVALHGARGGDVL